MFFDLVKLELFFCHINYYAFINTEFHTLFIPSNSVSLSSLYLSTLDKAFSKPFSNPVLQIIYNYAEDYKFLEELT